jgi:hypothetical protein
LVQAGKDLSVKASIPGLRGFLKEGAKVWGHPDRLGVHKTAASRQGKKIWVARIKTDGKTTCLGYFEDPSDAHAVYLAAKRKMHEGCTI